MDRMIESRDIKHMACVERIKKLEEENKKLKSDLSECECSMHFENDEVGYRKRECKNLKLIQETNEKQIQNDIKERDELREENRTLKERIDILYGFIERNDKLVDEVIDLEDLDKLNRYIYIDDDLVDRTLERED